MLQSSAIALAFGSRAITVAIGCNSVLFVAPVGAGGVCAAVSAALSSAVSISFVSCPPHEPNHARTAGTCVGKNFADGCTT